MRLRNRNRPDDCIDARGAQFSWSKTSERPIVMLWLFAFRAGISRRDCFAFRHTGPQHRVGYARGFLRSRRRELAIVTRAKTARRPRHRQSVSFRSRMANRCHPFAGAYPAGVRPSQTAQGSASAAAVAASSAQARYERDWKSEHDAPA